ncbi:hypothetical protein L2E82_02360 [Cichorium intybus]|uniref:Uncharacterized protein n=1 Tax=Cichorium intybus TaxID=13427 RepID=A0ACB9H322_CICIN|nr:hypothetical protein L2E82_02360 [Cichorium intybus]
MKSPSFPFVHEIHDHSLSSFSSPVIYVGYGSPPVTAMDANHLLSPAKKKNTEIMFTKVGSSHALSNTLESPQLENVNLETGHSGSIKLQPEPGECSFRFSSLVNSMKQLLHFRKYKKVIELKEI